MKKSAKDISPPLETEDQWLRDERQRLQGRWQTDTGAFMLASVVQALRAGQPWESFVADLPGVDEVDNGRDLRGVPLSGGELAGADFEDAQMDYADLSRAKLSKADFRGAQLMYANLSLADLREAYFTGNFLMTRANFAGADLSNADLAFTTLTGVDLTGANLTYANLSHADLVLAKMEEAVLRDAVLDKTHLDKP